MKLHFDLQLGSIETKGKTVRLMLPMILALALAGSASAANKAANKIVTLESLLHEMTDRDSLARWPEPRMRAGSQAVMTGTRRRRTIQAVGSPITTGASSFAVRNIRAGGVGDDGRGRSGAVVRFWTGGKEATGTVRFYLDGAAEPVIAGQMQNLLGGAASCPHHWRSRTRIRPATCFCRSRTRSIARSPMRKSIPRIRLHRRPSDGTTSSAAPTFPGPQ